MPINTNQIDSHQETDSAISLKDVFTILQFLVRAILRHKLLIVITVISVTTLTFGVVKILPRTYVVSTRVMTHSSQTISELAQTRRNMWGDSTTFGVEEIMKSRENLISIIEESNLISLYLEQRSKIGRYKDKLFQAIFGKPTQEELLDNLIQILEKQLHVYTEGSENPTGGNVVNITIEWRHPQTALDLQKIILNKFLDERRALELGEIKETIRLLEGKVREADLARKKIVDKNRKIISETADVEEEPTVAPQVQRVPRRKPVNEPSPLSVSPKELGMVTAELETTQSEIARLRTEHTQRLNQEKQNLAEIATLYGPQHPDIIRSKKYVELLSNQTVVPPRLLEKEKSLLAFLKKVDAQKEEIDATTRAPRNGARMVRSTGSQNHDDSVDQEMVESLINTHLTSLEVHNAETEVHRNKQKLANAKMELKATEAAFAYRYRVTQPPLFPKRPAKPNSLKIFIGGFFLSWILGFLFAIFADIRSGLIIESWQVEKILNVPLLGEINKP